MDISQLEVFLAVAREGGFSRAADKLYRTQSAVSQAIRKLETELGEPLFDRSARDVLEFAKMSPEEIDLVVLHQANIRILEAAAEELDVERRKMFVNLEKYGNTSGGSIPLALDEAVDQGRVQRGNNLLLCGFGAGLAWGTALWRW
jgi:3-oxoacyl-[acyl-carrier-protein] synthase III